MVWGVTLKRSARASTLTRPSDFASATMSACLGVSTSIPGPSRFPIYFDFLRWDKSLREKRRGDWYEVRLNPHLFSIWTEITPNPRPSPGDPVFRFTFFLVRSQRGCASRSLATITLEAKAFDLQRRLIPPSARPVGQH